MNLLNILSDRNIRQLFREILLCMLAFAAIATVFTFWGSNDAAGGMWLCCLGMGTAIMAVCYRYLKKQNAAMETAVEQIREYISGNGTARIESDEEGELYRLFHEVNHLAAILSAHAENEGREKTFLKNTISDISHQLKTPLAALNIYNGIIREEADNRTVREFLDFSEQELDRIQALVQNLLNVAKFDAGIIVLDKKPQNVSEMMEDVRKRFAFRAGQEGKDILLAGDETLCFPCDCSWFTEAMGNLVKNALDHTRAGEKVIVEWKRSASMLQIAVRDNGSGIHQEDLYHIFKRFYRSRFSEEHQGVGLGLPLAKSIIEAHNGSIRVDSRLGEGTVFTVNFLSAL
ncbi:MAG: HAMP domain-containing histidine kinase [Eubacterium sp.]|nr:HAMP domain-containing histidine kinase [Eubacterium sp.]